MTENKIVENDTLYHYTTQEGLIGILESNCLWATHYKFLNDYSEIVSAKEKIFEFIEGMLFLRNYNINTKEDLESITKDIEQASINSMNAKQTAEKNTNVIMNYIKEQEFYITSFCEQHSENDSYINENGLLSQWRAYGGNGGYALIFNKDKLKKLINDTKIISIELKKVIYSDDNSINSFGKILKHHVETQEENKLKNEYYDYHIDLATRYKNCGFKEEREFRIVAQLLPSFSIIERKFRCNNGEQIPYIELFNPSEPAIFPTASTLPIEKIIVGPHKDKEARATWLKIKLASIGRSDIKVTVSKIPFVGR